MKLMTKELKKKIPPLYSQENVKDPELGYFSLSELEKVRGPLGLRVERDLYWEPKPLSEVRKEIMASRKKK